MVFTFGLIYLTMSQMQFQKPVLKCKKTNIIHNYETINIFYLLSIITSLPMVNTYSIIYCYYLYYIILVNAPFLYWNRTKISLNMSTNFNDIEYVLYIYIYIYNFEKYNVKHAKVAVFKIKNCEGLKSISMISISF